MTPPSVAHLTKKRLDLRSPGKNRKKPIVPRVRWIVGDDFKAVFSECQRLLEAACQPAKGGRPRKFAVSGSLSGREG